MSNVVFVAPFFRETTLRFVKAAGALPGVRLGLVSQDPVDRLPPEVAAMVAVHERIESGLDPSSILGGVRRIRQSLGSVDRLLGTLEELQVPLGEVREALGISGMDATTARGFRDKSHMKDVLRAAGVPCARHALVADPSELSAAVTRVGFPMVAKPPQGSGARGTFRLEGPADLASLVRVAPLTPDRPLLLEEFLVGDEHSFDSATVAGRIVWWSVNHYRPSPLEVLREPWIQWTVLLPRESDGPGHARIREVAQHALGALGLVHGLSHMEWFLRPDGDVAVSEVGARPPGAQFTTLISYAHDADLYRRWAELSVFDRFDPLDRPFAAGAAYLRAQGPGGRVDRLEGLESLRRELGDLVVEARLPRPGQAPSGTYEGEGWVILRHPETEVVEAGLRRLVESVRVTLA